MRSFLTCIPMVCVTMWGCAETGGRDATPSGDQAGPSAETPSSTAAPKPVTADTSKPVSSAQTAAPGLPGDLAAVMAGGKLAAGPFAFPKGKQTIVVDGGSDRFTVAWQAGATPGTMDLPAPPTKVVLRDVNGDGTPELVVFKKTAPTGDDTTVWIFGTDKTGDVNRMWKLELMLTGVTDEASFDAELAKKGTLGAVTGVPLPRVIVRLENATPPELRALVGPGGVKVCNRLAEKKTCKTVATASIDAKKVLEIAHIGGPFAELGDDTPDGLGAPTCQADEKIKTRWNCFASIGGPKGGQWVFDVTPSGTRLVEVWSWAENS